MRSRSGGLVWLWACAWLLLLGGTSHAAGVGTAFITFESELWALNGDTERQPLVPEVQKLDAPPIIVTDSLTVTPSVNNVTRVDNFKSDFGGGASITVTKTTGGATFILPNPTNRFDPFTGKFEADVHNRAGTAMGPPWTAQVPVDINTSIVLDEIAAGGRFFVAEISIPGAVGDPREGDQTFTGNVALLNIPIRGTAFPDKFTTGTVTVMRQIITARAGGDVNGTPTGFKTFTFTGMGSATPMKLVFVTPVVIESIAGTGEQEIPIPVIGFARATNTGFTYDVPEPGLWLGLGAAGLGLAFLARRRRAA